MKYITITQKDIEKAGIQNSDSGFLIDELAYSAKQWTSNDLFENGIDYQPSEPYNYDFEADLLKNTKTWGMLNNIASQLGGCTIPSLITVARSKLQAGAYMALNNPNEWEKLLEAYTDELKTNFTDGISQEYNEALQSEINDYEKQQFKEWLNGDYTNYRGVVYEISKYFTSNDEGSYDQEKNEYTFALDDEDVENFVDMGYHKNQFKKALLDHIKGASDSHRADERVKREKAQAEFKRLAEYKAEQTKANEKARKAKLEAMTL